LRSPVAGLIVAVGPPRADLLAPARLGVYSPRRGTSLHNRAIGDQATGTQCVPAYVSTAIYETQRCLATASPQHLNSPKQSHSEDNMKNHEEAIEMLKADHAAVKELFKPRTRASDANRKFLPMCVSATLSISSMRISAYLNGRSETVTAPDKDAPAQESQRWLDPANSRKSRTSGPVMGRFRGRKSS
jgi:hypothetical protein